MTFQQQQQPQYQTVPSSHMDQPVLEGTEYTVVGQPRGFHDHVGHAQATSSNCQPEHSCRSVSSQYRQQQSKGHLLNLSSSSTSQPEHSIRSVCSRYQQQPVQDLSKLSSFRNSQDHSFTSANGQYQQQQLSVQDLSHSSSSSGFSSTCRLNGTQSVASTRDSGTGFDCSLWVNYNCANSEKNQGNRLSYRNVCSGDRASADIYTSVGCMDSGDSGLSDRRRIRPENLKFDVITEENHLLNKLVNCKIVDDLESSTLLRSPSSIAPHSRCTHNHVQNCFHSMPSNHLSGVQHPPHNSPQFMALKAACISPSFDHRHCLHSSRHSLHSPSSNLPRVVALSSKSGYPSPDKVFKPGDGTRTMRIPHLLHKSIHCSPKQINCIYTYCDLDPTDLDQPTKFSQEFNEVVEDNCGESYQEKPINFSVHICDSGKRNGHDTGAYRDKRHCIECKYTEVRRAEDIGYSKDQIQTFTTEGSLGLSESSSLSSLIQSDRSESEGGVVVEVKQVALSGEVCPAGPQLDSMMATGGSRSEMLDRQQWPAFICGVKGVELCCSSDQIKTYCEEDSPICLSRLSSLSSLHSSDQREGMGLAQLTSISDEVLVTTTERADNLQLMVKSTRENTISACPISKSPSVLPCTNTDQALPGGGQVETTAIDENQIDDSPLMFSRSSSPTSLSSFDTQSVRSSVVSEYSWKTDELVSPSEIPDSPSESLPSCPRQNHSVTMEEVNNFPQTPNSTNVQSFKNTPSTVKAEKYRTCPDVDKPVSFRVVDTEVPDELRFSVFDNQDVTPVVREPVKPCSAFCTFQNIQHMDINTCSHDVSRLLTLQQTDIPVFQEQCVDAQSSSETSEVPVVYAEEGSPSQFSEATDLSEATEASSSIRGGVVKQSSVQFSELDLPSVEGKMDQQTDDRQGPTRVATVDKQVTTTVEGKTLQMLDRQELTRVEVADRQVPTRVKDKMLQMVDRQKPSRVEMVDNQGPKNGEMVDRHRPVIVEMVDRHEPSRVEMVDRHEPSRVEMVDRHEPSRVEMVDRHEPSRGKMVDRHEPSRVDKVDRHQPVIVEMVDRHGPSRVDKVDRHQPVIVEMVDRHGPSRVEMVDRHRPSREEIVDRQGPALSLKDAEHICLVSEANCEDTFLSDISEGEEDILAACINSAMPKPVFSTHRGRSGPTGTPKIKSRAHLTECSDVYMRYPSNGVTSVMKTVPKRCTASRKPPNSSHVVTSSMKTVPKKFTASGKPPTSTVQSNGNSFESKDLQMPAMIELHMTMRKNESVLIGATADYIDDCSKTPPRGVSRSSFSFSSKLPVSSIPTTRPNPRRLPMSGMKTKLKHRNQNVQLFENQAESPETMVDRGGVFELCSDYKGFDSTYFESRNRRVM